MSRVVHDIAPEALFEIIGLNACPYCRASWVDTPPDIPYARCSGPNWTLCMRCDTAWVAEPEAFRGALFGLLENEQPG